VQLIVVDASGKDATERLLAAPRIVDAPAETFQYFRLPATMRGLTRQRNFGLRHVFTDLVVFFDDDVELLPGCLREMEAAHRLLGARAAGVGAHIEGGQYRPTMLWRLRRFLYVVSSLRAGTYQLSGMSIPWWSVDEGTRVIEGDWLHGCAMMWKTEIARQVGFNEAFDGYAQAEDLDFCLRARGRGKLYLVPAARVRHLRDPQGRPDAYRLGFMEIHNRFQVLQRARPPRRRLVQLWFFYAWIVDTLLLARDVVRPGTTLFALKRIMGRVGAFYEILRPCLA